VRRGGKGLQGQASLQIEISNKTERGERKEVISAAKSLIGFGLGFKGKTLLLPGADSSGGREALKFFSFWGGQCGWKAPEEKNPP